MSVSQLMNQGVISLMQRHCRGDLIKSLCNDRDVTQSWNQITLSLSIMKKNYLVDFFFAVDVMVMFRVQHKENSI